MIDCGAHVGAFSRVMVERFGCRVLAFEPSPQVFRQLPVLRGLEARNVAVCGKNGSVRLEVHADSTRTAIRLNEDVSGSTIEVPGRTLTSLMDEAGVIGPIEILKLDIEGAELGVIDSLTDDLLLRIGQITVEFHDFLGYHTTEEVEDRIRRVTALGFRELYWSRRRNTADVLLINGNRLGPIRHAFEQGPVRQLRGAGRVIWRKLALWGKA